MVDEIANLKALEQQPCEDCISRQAVKDIICSGVSIDTDADKEYVCELIDKLPSVTPKEKIGKWINKTLIYKSEEGSEYDCYTGTCSVCGETQECWNYCSGCGARMIEPQESENRE